MTIARLLPKRFYEWYWFRKKAEYKRRYLPLRIIKIYEFNSFLVDNYPDPGRQIVIMGE